MTWSRSLPRTRDDTSFTRCNDNLNFYPALRLENHQRSSNIVRALFSILARYEMAEPPLKKLAPKRKCKFNDDWRRDFAWIEKLADTDMVQCND